MERYSHYAVTGRPRFGMTRETPARRVRPSFRSGLLPSADGSCVPAAPPGPAAIGKQTLFRKSAPVLENQQRRHRERRFQRDLVLAAPRRRKRWGKWRQRCALRRGQARPPSCRAKPPPFIILLHMLPGRSVAGSVSGPKAPLLNVATSGLILLAPLTSSNPGHGLFSPSTGCA